MILRSAKLDLDKRHITMSDIEEDEIVEDASGPRGESPEDEQRANVDQQTVPERSYQSREIPITTRIRITDDSTVLEIDLLGTPPYTYETRMIGNPGKTTDVQVYHLERDAYHRVQIEELLHRVDQGGSYVSQEVTNRIADSSISLEGRREAYSDLTKESLSEKYLKARKRAKDFHDSLKDSLRESKTVGADVKGAVVLPKDVPYHTVNEGWQTPYCSSFPGELIDPIYASALLSYNGTLPVLEVGSNHVKHGTGASASTNLYWRTELWCGDLKMAAPSGRVPHLCYRILAYTPSSAKPEVREMTRRLPRVLEVQEASRTTKFDAWPKAFQRRPPTDGDIALCLVPWNESVRTGYMDLLNRMIALDHVLIGQVESADILIFASCQLKFEFHDARRDSKFLWGVFRNKNRPTV